MHQLIILIAKYLIVIPVILAIYVWLGLDKSAKKQFIGMAIVAGIITYGLAKIGGALFYDSRPFVVGHFTPYFSHAGDNGFPSDHTLFGSWLGFLVIRYSRKLGYVTLALAVLVGLARVAAGVHHLIDIIAAFVFAAIGMAVATMIWKLAAKHTKV